jgi:hypothetical protein
MYLFGKNSMPDVDNLLTSFYQLDDEARKSSGNDTVQITVSQRQREGRTSKANKRLVKIQTPMKLGTIFIGVLFMAPFRHRFTYFHCCKVSKRASRFLGKPHKIQLFTNEFARILFTR